MRYQPNPHVTCTGCPMADACGAGCGEAHACGGGCANPRTRGLSRRDFIKMALAAGLLAGCSPLGQPTSQIAETQPPSPSPSPSGWSVLHEITTQKPARVAAFHDDTFGLLFLYPDVEFNTNDIRVTDDGGQTWSETTAEDDHCRFGVDIVERGIIWNCGRGTPNGRQPGAEWSSGVSRSIDEGRSWENVSPIEGVGPVHPHGVNKGAAWGCHPSFLDDQTGWVASNYTFVATTSDGGQSWSVLPLPETIPNIAAIHFLTPDEGYVLDYVGNLHVTHDAGQNWASQELIRAEGMTMLQSDFIANTAAMRFVDENNGLVATTMLGGGRFECIVMRTSDGGRTWQKETLPIGLALSYDINRDCTLVTAIDYLEVERITVLKYA